MTAAAVVVRSGKAQRLSDQYSVLLDKVYAAEREFMAITGHESGHHADDAVEGFNKTEDALLTLMGAAKAKGQ